MSKKCIAIFASGQGTNAETIIEHFKNHPTVQVALVLTNNPNAGVLAVAQRHKITSAIVSKEFLGNKAEMTKLLSAQQISFVVLAGFLQLIPSFLIEQYPQAMVNIHPALLPAYGGKGMFGKKVHEKVLANKEKQTGITIHFVNEEYDAGKIILQQTTEVTENDTAETISQRIRQLEHAWYPSTIEKLLM